MHPKDFIDYLEFEKLHIVINREGELILIPKAGGSSPTWHHKNLLREEQEILIPWLVEELIGRMSGLLFQQGYRNDCYEDMDFESAYQRLQKYKQQDLDTEKEALKRKQEKLQDQELVLQDEQEQLLMQEQVLTDARTHADIDRNGMWYDEILSKNYRMQNRN